MSYIGDFDRAFMRHTLSLVGQYTGPYDATLLLNCLLGLLIVPKETAFKYIPEDPPETLWMWGINPDSIEAYGSRPPQKGRPPLPYKEDSLKGIVHSLRNAVAHFRFAPYPPKGEVTGFRFSDDSGFKANISLSEMKTFVEKLALHLEKS